MAGRGIAGSEGDLGAACFCAPASPAGFMALTEITCVYALGPLGGAGGPGAGSMFGRAKARVAPSEGRADGVIAGAFGGAGFSGSGVRKTICGGARYDTGCAGTEVSFGGSGRTGAGSTAARGRPLDGGGALEARKGISGVNNPVNPVPAGSFPAIPAAGNYCICIYKKLEIH